MPYTRCYCLLVFSLLPEVHLSGWREAPNVPLVCDVLRHLGPEVPGHPVPPGPFRAEAQLPTDCSSTPGCPSPDTAAITQQRLHLRFYFYC